MFLFAKRDLLGRLCIDHFSKVPSQNAYQRSNFYTEITNLKQKDHVLLEERKYLVCLNM